jgi:hypothetical protein
MDEKWLRLLEWLGKKHDHEDHMKFRGQQAQKHEKMQNCMWTLQSTPSILNYKTFQESWRVKRSQV